MKEQSNFGPHLTVILKEMCKYVNADFDKIDFKEDNWYYKYWWSEKKEEEFKDWLVNYMYNNSKARKELMTIPTKNKKHCQQFANGFILNYGWKTKTFEMLEKELEECKKYLPYIMRKENETN